MFKFIVVFAACLACAAANPGVLAPTAFAAAPAVAYANTPLYAAGGSSQVDVRHNYDGSLSSYTTAPFNYAGPYSSRYVAGVPSAAYAAGPAAFAAPTAFAAAPAKYVAPAGVAAHYAAPYATPYGTPYAAQYAAPYSAQYAAPYAAQYAAPYAAQYAAPYAAPYAAHFAAPFAAPAVAAAAPVLG